MPRHILPLEFVISFFEFGIEDVDLVDLVLQLGLVLLQVIGQLGVLVLDALHFFRIYFLKKCTRLVNKTNVDVVKVAPKQIDNIKNKMAPKIV